MTKSMKLFTDQFLRTLPKLTKALLQISQILQMTTMDRPVSLTMQSTSQSQPSNIPGDLK